MPISFNDVFIMHSVFSGPTSDGNDDPEDEDGIRLSQFRDREARSVSVDHW